MKIPVSLVLFVRNDCSPRPEYWTQIREKKSERYGGFYEFPGGKIEEGETPKRAAVREVKEEVGIIINEDDLILFKIFESDKVNLYTFLCAGPYELKNRDFWLSKKDLQEKDIPPINFQITDEVDDLLQRESLENLWSQ